MVGIVVKRYAVREAEKRRYAVRKRGGGVTLIWRARSKIILGTSRLPSEDSSATIRSLLASAVAIGTPRRFLRKQTSCYDCCRWCLKRTRRLVSGS